MLPRVCCFQATNTSQEQHHQPASKVALTCPPATMWSNLPGQVCFWALRRATHSALLPSGRTTNPLICTPYARMPKYGAAARSINSRGSASNAGVTGYSSSLQPDSRPWSWRSFNSTAATAWVRASVLLCWDARVRTEPGSAAAVAVACGAVLSG